MLVITLIFVFVLFHELSKEHGHAQCAQCPIHIFLSFVCCGVGLVWVSSVHFGTVQLDDIPLECIRQ